MKREWVNSDVLAMARDLEAQARRMENVEEAVVYTVEHRNCVRSLRAAAAHMRMAFAELGYVAYSDHSNIFPDAPSEKGEEHAD